MPGGPLLGFPPGALPPSVTGAGPHPPPPGHPLPLPHPLIKAEPREEQHAGNNKHSAEEIRNVRIFVTHYEFLFRSLRESSVAIIYFCYQRNSLSPMEHRERERDRDRDRERERERERMRMRSPPSEPEARDSLKRRKEEIKAANNSHDRGDVSDKSSNSGLVLLDSL